MSGKKKIIRRMYSRLARRYDLANRLISGGSDRRWRRAAAGALPRHGWLVDLGTGTGEMTLAYFRRQPSSARVVLVDFNREMLQRARQKLSATPWRENVNYILADFERLPFRSSVFAGAMSAFVLRNLPSLPPALSETCRILRHDGRAVFLEATHPSRNGWRQVFDIYWRRLMPRLAALANPGRNDAYHYLARSVAELVPPARIADYFRQAGFAGCHWRPMFGGAVTTFFADREMEADTLPESESAICATDEKTTNETVFPT